MKSRTAIVAASALALCGFVAFAYAGRPVSPRPALAAAPAHPVVVELFTSQGCSSCPPADAALDRFSRDPNIVAISRPVTYWDDLGWRDTLARPANTALQRSYAARLADNDVYTPQAVVQGNVALLGGRTGAIHRAVDEALAHPGPSLAVEGGAGGRALVLDGAAARPAEIRLLALRARVPVAIGRGENGGRTVDYVNVVVAEDVIGGWRGGHLRLALPAARLRAPGADRYAVIVQLPNAGPILAAHFL